MLPADAGAGRLVLDYIAFAEEPQLADFRASELAGCGEISDIAVGDAEALRDIVGTQAPVRAHG